MSEPAPIVLVVDDEIQIRRFLRTRFELNGFVVHEAGTGAEAVRTATLRPIDLAIVDLGLPDMDGAEVVERVRSWSSVPIIVLSVRSAEAEKVRLLELGADDYVVSEWRNYWHACEWRSGDKCARCPANPPSRPGRSRSILPPARSC